MIRSVELPAALIRVGGEAGSEKGTAEDVIDMSVREKKVSDA